MKLRNKEFLNKIKALQVERQKLQEKILDVLFDETTLEYLDEAKLKGNNNFLLAYSLGAKLAGYDSINLLMLAHYQNKTFFN